MTYDRAGVQGVLLWSGLIYVWTASSRFASSKEWEWMRFACARAFWSRWESSPPLGAPESQRAASDQHTHAPAAGSRQYHHEAVWAGGKAGRFADRRAPMRRVVNHCSVHRIRGRQRQRSADHRRWAGVSGRGRGRREHRAGSGGGGSAVRGKGLNGRSANRRKSERQIHHNRT